MNVVTGWSRFGLLAGAAPLALLASLTGAAAQDTSAPTAGAAGADQATPVSQSTQAPEAGDIIVTANRFSQPLQRVSASVDVINGQELSRTATTNIAQALATTPGVNVTSQPGGSSINVRGLGADVQSGATQGSVALEFDGVYNIISLGTQTGFFDLDRVEVLKGPQSTRYGPNAEGGIVNVISNDAKLGDNSGHAALTVGNFGLVRGEIAQNIALTDTLALRIAAAAMHRNSYFSPDLGNNIAQSLRVKLLFQPISDLTIKLAYQLDHVGGTGFGSEAAYPVILNKVAPYSGDSINDNGNPWHKGDTGTGTGDPQDSKASLYQHTFSGNVSYGISDAIALDVSGSYIKITGDETSCAHNGPPWNIGGDGVCFGVHEYAPFNQYSAEARLHSNGGPIQWNIGYYYWDYSQYKWSEAFQAVSGYAGGTELGTRTNALFGELTYPVTDSFRLIGGVRESWDQRTLKPSSVDATYHRNLSHFDFRAGEEFDIIPESMQYFTVSSGYRPGGLTYDGGIGDAVFFGSEKTVAYEFGLKNRLFNNRLTLNIDGFYYDQSNYQDIDSYAGFPVTLADGSSYVCQNGGGQPPACSVPTFNIKSAYNLGIEAQARVQATRNDIFGVNFTVMKARFSKNQGVCATVAAPAANGACYIGYNDQLTNALSFFDIAGKVQPHAPTFSTNVSYEHDFRFASGATISFGADAYHSSGYWVHPVQDAAKLGYQPAYWQENLQLSFTPAGERFSISGFVKNLSNYAVKQSTLPATTISDPRTYGATLGVRW